MPLLQPWYQERGKAIHIATYKDEKVMKREVEEAAKYGWKPENSAAIAGHINVGRTVAPAVFTGGLSLLLGASRSKDKMTITFVRDERALAREAVEDALGHFSSCQTRLQKATAEEASAHGEMETYAQEPLAGGQEHEKTQKSALKAARQLVDRQQNVVRHLEALIGSLTSVRAGYARADSVSITPSALSLMWTGK